MKQFDLPGIENRDASDVLVESVRKGLRGKYPMGVCVFYDPVNAMMEVIPVGCTEIEACGMMAIAPSVLMDSGFDEA